MVKITQEVADLIWSLKENYREEVAERNAHWVRHDVPFSSPNMELILGARRSVKEKLIKLGFEVEE